jgi:DNA-3-methyladenine glycosylase II
MKEALKHFKKTDPLLYSVAVRLPPLERRYYPNQEDYFGTLCRIIIGQQLSGKVAGTIYSRFLTLFPQAKVSPKRLLILKDDQLRGIGLSKSKTSYLKNLASAVVSGSLAVNSTHSWENDQIMEELTRIKGVGPWTVEMFLMFSLGRDDVFSFGDLGLKNAISKIYKLNNPSREEIEKIVTPWAPYRTFAALILWKSLENR